MRHGSMAELSLDLGHISNRANADEIEAHLALAKPLLDEYTLQHRSVSTSLLVGDAHKEGRSPREIIADIKTVANRLRMHVNYMGNEGALTEPLEKYADRHMPLNDDGYSLADIAYSRIHQPPVPGTTGGRSLDKEPLRTEVPKLSATGEIEYTDRLVYLLDKNGALRRTYKPVFIKAVWGAAQLGLLLDHDEFTPRPIERKEDSVRDSWHTLPPITRLERGARPFPGLSAKARRPRTAEAAYEVVGSILDRLVLDPEARAAHQKAALGRELGALASRYEVIYY